MTHASDLTGGDWSFEGGLGTHIHRGRAGGEVSLCSVGVRSVRLPLPLLTVCLCVRAHVRGIYECECACVCLRACVSFWLACFSLVTAQV